MTFVQFFRFFSQPSALQPPGLNTDLDTLCLPIIFVFTHLALFSSLVIAVLFNQITLTTFCWQCLSLIVLNLWAPMNFSTSLPLPALSLVFDSGTCLWCHCWCFFSQLTSFNLLITFALRAAVSFSHTSVSTTASLPQPRILTHAVCGFYLRLGVSLSFFLWYCYCHLGLLT